MISFLLVIVGLSVWPLSARTAHGDISATEELGFVKIEDVYAAAKHQQSLREAPASITIITDEDIRRYGHRTLTDVVNNVRGFYTYSDRNYDYIGVSGFARLGDYGNRVLQLVDGHTFNDNIYGSFFLGQQAVDMDLVKRIEFIRGPGSALYGSNAFFGTVNIVTKDGKDIDGLYAKVEGGGDNAFNGVVAYGTAFGNNGDLLLSFSSYNSWGRDHYYAVFDHPPASDGWARKIDGENAKKFSLKTSFSEFSFFAQMISREKQVPTASYGTIFNDSRLKTVDERAFAELRWDHAFDADRQLKARIYYDRYRFDGTYPYDYPPVIMNRDDVLGQWVGGEAAYNHKWMSHRFLIGGEIVRHIDAIQKNYDESPHVTYLEDNHTSTHASLFGQDEWAIASWVRFTAGLRFDHYSTFGGHLSPRAGLIMYPADTSTIKILYGQAFRAPNVFELYYVSETASSAYRSNPDLKPETLTTYEIVFEQELTPILKASASAFHYEAKDLISQQVNTDYSLQFRNIDRVRSDGAELELEWNWPGVFKGHISYTYQDTRDDLTGQWLANSPRHLVKAGIILPLYRNMIFLGAQGRYMGNRLDRDGNDVGDAAVLDLNLSATIRKLSLSLSVFNLLDTVYADPVSMDHVQKSILQNGRNIWLKVEYTF